MKNIELNKKGKRFYDLLKKVLPIFSKATELSIIYGMILTTPAKEIKKMKLRQIIKELKSLKAKMED